MSEEYVKIEADKIEVDEYNTYYWISWDFMKGYPEGTRFNFVNDFENNNLQSEHITVHYDKLTIIPNFYIYRKGESALFSTQVEPYYFNEIGIVYVDISILDKIQVKSEYNFITIRNDCTVYYTTIIYTNPGYIPEAMFVKEGDVVTLNEGVDIFDYTIINPYTGLKTIYGYFFDEIYCRDLATTETLSIPDLKIPEGEELEIMEARVVLTGNPDIRGTLRCRELIIEG